MLSYKWELFHVGMRRAEWVGLPDGLRMEWTDQSGLVLFAYYNRPIEAEIAEMRAERRFEIAFKDIEGVGFFTVKLGDLPWGIAPLLLTCMMIYLNSIDLGAV